MLSIFKREFKSYFTNMTGYLVIGVMFIFCGIFTTAICLVNGYSSFEVVLSQMVTVIMFLVPILTMKSLAEDRRSRTDQLLYSLPISMTQIVLGKYFALVAIFGISCAGMAFVPPILSAFVPEESDYSLTSAYAALLGFFLLGASLIAICMFFSGLTESQIIAAVLGLAVSLAFYLMNALAYLLPTTAAGSLACFIVVALLVAALMWFLTKNYLVGAVAGVILLIPTIICFVLMQDKFEGLFPSLIEYLAIFDRYSLMTNGVFDVTAIIYFISMAVFFLFLSVQSMEKRRWN